MNLSHHAHVRLEHDKLYCRIFYSDVKWYLYCHHPIARKEKHKPATGRSAFTAADVKPNMVHCDLFDQIHVLQLDFRHHLMPSSGKGIATATNKSPELYRYLGPSQTRTARLSTTNAASEAQQQAGPALHRVSTRRRRHVPGRPQRMDEMPMPSWVFSHHAGGSSRPGRRGVLAASAAFVSPSGSSSESRWASVFRAWFRRLILSARVKGVGPGSDDVVGVASSTTTSLGADGAALRGLPPRILYAILMVLMVYIFSMYRSYSVSGCCALCLFSEGKLRRTLGKNGR